MNLEQIKNDYDIKYDFEDWDSFINYIPNHEVETHMDKICILAQKECLKLASERLIWREDKELLEDITNENNIIK